MTNSEKAMVFGATTLAGLLIVAALLFRVGPGGDAPADPPPEKPVETPLAEEDGPPVESLPVEEVVAESEDIFPEEQQIPPQPEGPILPPEEPEEQKQREITLFFQSPFGEELMPEERFIFETDSTSDQIRQVVRELIRGPATELLPTIPRGTELREVYLATSGTAYIDFSQAFVDEHPGGSAAEIETVFSLANTLAFNFTQVQRIRILVEGEERPTLREHLDLSRSFVADMSLVKSMEL